MAFLNVVSPDSEKIQQTVQNDEPKGINDIPYELLHYIFSFLPYLSLMSCSLTCKYWRGEVKNFWSLQENHAPDTWVDAIQKNPQPKMWDLPPRHDDENDPLLFKVKDFEFETLEEQYRHQLYVDDVIVQVLLDGSIWIYSINPPKSQGDPLTSFQSLPWTDSDVKDGVLQIREKTHLCFLSLSSGHTLARANFGNLRNGSSEIGTQPFACVEERYLYYSLNQYIYLCDLDTKCVAWKSSKQELDIAIVEAGFGLLVTLDENCNLGIWNCSSSDPFFKLPLSTTQNNLPFKTRKGCPVWTIKILKTCGGSIVRVVHIDGKTWSFLVDEDKENVIHSRSFTALKEDSFHVKELHKTYLTAIKIFKTEIRVAQVDCQLDISKELNLPITYLSEDLEEIKHLQHFFIKTSGKLLGAIGPDIHSIILWDLESNTKLTTLSSDTHQLVTFFIVPSGSIVGISSTGHMLIWNFAQKERKIKARRGKIFS